MEKKKRLFIAITLPSYIRDYIASTIIKQLRKDSLELLYESEAKLHITLSFLGWTTIEPDQITEVLYPTLAITSKESLTISITHLNAFYGPRFVLYLNVNKTKKLSTLQKAIAQKITTLGFESDTRKFIPHITIARSKSIQHSFQKKLIKNLNNKPVKLPDPFEISYISLMQSRPSQRGSKYRALAAIPLPKLTHK